ncbi:MAG: hypothetical protein E7076_01755 [Bacteroidales bacterium]|nr:hypothetical protein [Bacteroidales bacterium]
MDGTTIQKFFQQEALSMLDAYKNFETLIPSPKGAGAEHKGEDGRFVENLIRSFLSKYLPKELEVLTGFIVRPAVKVGKNDKSRRNENDHHSTQLDIVIYNSAHYPVFLRSNDTVIVPPEGVICIISVKKTLNPKDIKDELYALKEASKLCRSNSLRGPYLALVSMDNNIIRKRPETIDWIFKNMKSLYDADDDLAFDDMIGYIGAVKHWGILKKRPNKKNPKEARYVMFKHDYNTENHLWLQFLLTGILSVYYDNSRTNITRPGFTSFPSGRNYDRELGIITAKIPAKITD